MKDAKAKNDEALEKAVKKKMSKKLIDKAAQELAANALLMGQQQRQPQLIVS